MEENAIFFMSFLQCLEKNADDLSLMEPERSVISSTYQVVGVDVLYDAQWSSHGVWSARMLPKQVCV
jgi:hypothetical protein